MKERKTCFYNISGKGKAVKFFTKKYNIPIEENPENISSYDTVYFSLHTWRDFYTLAKLRRYKGNSEWVGGGNALQNPTGAINLLDYAFIGDAFYAFEEIHKGARDIKGMLNTRDIKEVEFNDESVYPENISKIEIILSKGCKRRCLFCVNPWRTEYKENNEGNIVDFVKVSKNKQVFLISNSSDDVSFYHDTIMPVLEERNIVDMCCANSVSAMTEDYLKRKQTPLRFGIEGMSEELRHIINKPISRDKYMDALDKVFRNEKQADLLYQFNLPGERLDDFDEMIMDMEYVQRKYTKISLGIAYTPNQPSPMTPLQWEKPYYNTEMVDRIMEWRKRHIEGKRVGTLPTYVATPLYPKKWFMQILGEWIPIKDKHNLIFNRIKNKKETVENMINIFKDNGEDIEFIFKKKEFDYIFPWDIIKVNFSKDEIWKFRNKMYERLEKYNRM